MFSRARFDLARFSLAGDGSSDVYLRATFSDSLRGLFGAGVDYSVTSMTLSAALFQVAGGAQGVPASLFLAEGLTAGAQAILAAPIQTTLAESLGARAQAGADYCFTILFPAALEQLSRLGADIYLEVLAADQLEADARIGADLQYRTFLSAILNLLSDAGNLETAVASVAVTLQPGSEMRIDSEHFTVTLDGENILHLQEGDWIDLDRDLWALVVDTGSGGQLTGSLIYTERYL